MCSSRLLSALSLDIAAAPLLVAGGGVQSRDRYGVPRHAAGCADPETGLHLKLRAGHRTSTGLHATDLTCSLCKVTWEGRAARAFALQGLESKQHQARPA